MVSAWERALQRNEGPAAPVKRRYQDMTPAGRRQLLESVKKKNLAPPQSAPRPAQPSTEEMSRLAEQKQNFALMQRAEELMPTQPMFGQPEPTPTLDEYVARAEENRAIQEQNRPFWRELAFGPERSSVFGGEASLPERVVRDWGFSEQEFRTAAERAQEGRLGAAAGWGLLGLAGAVPFFGDIAQGVAGASRAASAVGDVARAADTASDIARTAEQVADAGRLAENRWADAWRDSQAGQDWRAPDISEGVSQEILNESMQFTLPQERLASIPEQRRPTAEVFHRQQFDAEPQVIKGKFFYPAVDSSGGTPIYRGLSAASEDEAAQYAQQFLSGEYHIGIGFNGIGSYFGTDPRTALEYASMMSRDFPQGRPGAIVRAIVPPTARIFDDSLDSALTRSIMRSFSASNFDDLGMYLAALGYDGQRVKRLGEEYIVMYNRGILKADESVYKVPAGLKRQKDEGGWEGMSQILRNIYGEDFVR